MERSEGLITNLGIKSPVTEAYRTLRTNLKFISPDKPLKTILITSSGPGEGKSTTSANIAISMAQDGKKVLLIDCDLRKPVQHKIFHLSNTNGLSSALVDIVDLVKNEMIKETEISNLHIMTSGHIPPNPAELLGSKKMSRLIKELEEIYDVIILDTPPVISVTDAIILSPIVDGVILVVCRGIAEKAMVIKAAEMIKNVNGNLIGVVFNRVIYERGYEKYYYYDSDSKRSIS